MHCVIIRDAQACPYRDSNAREVTGVIQAATKAIGNGEIDSQLCFVYLLSGCCQVSSSTAAIYGYS